MYVDAIECQLEFCECFIAWASFPCDGFIEIGRINSGLCGEFTKADFLGSLFGSGTGFGGLFLFVFKVVDCGLEPGDDFRRGGGLCWGEGGDFSRRITRNLCRMPP